MLIETTVEDGDVQVAIQDDGPGIPAMSCRESSSHFSRRKGKGEGTGLGLGIVHRIVEKHGGTIRVTCEPGCTRFEVRIPIDGPAARARDRVASARRRGLPRWDRRERIPRIARCVSTSSASTTRRASSRRCASSCGALRRRVRDRGRAVAREALELIDELQRDGEPLAVVIADQIMPGMKGVELLEEVHRRCPEHDEDPAHRPGRPRRGRLRHQPRGPQPVHPQAVGRAATCGSPSRTSCRAFRLERERQELLVASSSARTTSCATLNSSLEEKVQERTRELERLNARLAELAVTDGLTGLYNHRHFHERLSLEMERSDRTGLPLSVLMIDVDHFKIYNDRHGHLAGDDALRGVLEDPRARAARQRRRRALRRRGVRDHPARRRQGQRRATSASGSPRRSPSSRSSSAAQPAGRRGSRSRSASRRSPTTAAEPAMVLAAADRALFAAKNAGRNTVRVAGQ